MHLIFSSYLAMHEFNMQSPIAMTTVHQHSQNVHVTYYVLAWAVFSTSTRAMQYPLLLLAWYTMAEVI